MRVNRVKNETRNFILGPRKKESSILPRIPRNRGQKTQESTGEIADTLVDIFQSPEYRNFFLRTAWRLEVDTINRHLASAFELGTNKRAYFISLIKKDERYGK